MTERELNDRLLELAGGGQAVTKGGYPATEACAKCRGRCCESYSGAAFPEDFGEPLLENLSKALRSGHWAIDWWEGDPSGHDENREDVLGCCYFIRPRHKSVTRLRDPSWGGECIYLTPTGCVLPFDRRPHGCRYLEPGPRCVAHDGAKQGAALAWLRYQDIILQAEGNCRPRRRALAAVDGERP